MLGFIVFALENGEDLSDGGGSLGTNLILGAVAIGIWYAIGKWREGK